MHLSYWEWALFQCRFNKLPFSKVFEHWLILLIKMHVYILNNWEFLMLIDNLNPDKSYRTFLNIVSTCIYIRGRRHWKRNHHVGGSIIKTHLLIYTLCVILCLEKKKSNKSSMSHISIEIKQTFLTIQSRWRRFKTYQCFTVSTFDKTSTIIHSVHVLGSNMGYTGNSSLLLKEKTLKCSYILPLITSLMLYKLLIFTRVFLNV